MYFWRNMLSLSHMVQNLRANIQNIRRTACAGDDNPLSLRQMATSLELLAPARNLDFGKEAINHGADAVYIGGPAFSARSAAGNTITEIEALCHYAHFYRAKVYVALNTLLYDNEFEEAVEIIRQVYQAGADALIIQDMGLLMTDLPPIPLFASTQTHNHSPARVQFLEEAGFSRVILARELSLRQIADIRRQTTVDLEAFVHGAICVSYSGQCYMSHAITGRSGNRGQCAQMCRLPFEVLDSNQKTIGPKAYYLSPRDLNLSDYLPQLAEAGVSSFKIEGRLKDIYYLKNITALYRQKLDNYLESTTGYTKASAGRVRFTFTPQPNATFNRGYTSYFIEGKRGQWINPESPKSMGELAGKLVSVNGNQAEIDTSLRLAAGDGFFYTAATGQVEGFRINKAEGNTVYVHGNNLPRAGTLLFRNQPAEFEKLLSAPSAVREIAVRLVLVQTPEGWRITATDEDGHTASLYLSQVYEPARNPQLARDKVHKQWSKSGVEGFKVECLQLPDTFAAFIPDSQLNAIRRHLLNQLYTTRLAVPRSKAVRSLAARVSRGDADFSFNITNAYSQKFYESCGYQVLQQGADLTGQFDTIPLMTTKYCLRYQLGLCQKLATGPPSWYLRDDRRTYRLEFDCTDCQMKVYRGDI